MQPDERRIIILDEIPGQDESDASTSTKGRRTNRSSISQLPKGSVGRTRQQASARPATSLTRTRGKEDMRARPVQSTPQGRTAGAPMRTAEEDPMRTAADSRVVPPEQSIWSHHLLRGPRRGSPQGSGDRRHHQLQKDQVTRRHAWGGDHPHELRRHGPMQLIPTQECFRCSSACDQRDGSLLLSYRLRHA